ncbi:hypothetical protein C7M61_002964 [Candidozyma pseudohaemuli]|uniref:Uncharacterized protein n=1 Tax=Candidozyma pseudohaemuli TaxID=418784 RepID=A0A2P7YR01_9ASCO|nr:hypothetical protein C7M61_002964 [[Candida] pseudohaemulonii]PSK38401.1 hypothetical protein C7M61_002964 [[Candida] pseudohaemulonii]
MPIPITVAYSVDAGVIHRNFSFDYDALSAPLCMFNPLKLPVFAAKDESEISTETRQRRLNFVQNIFSKMTEKFPLPLLKHFLVAASLSPRKWPEVGFTKGDKEYRFCGFLPNGKPVIYDYSAVKSIFETNSWMENVPLLNAVGILEALRSRSRLEEDQSEPSSTSLPTPDSNENEVDSNGAYPSVIIDSPKQDFDLDPCSSPVQLVPEADETNGEDAVTYDETRRFLNFLYPDQTKALLSFDLGLPSIALASSPELCPNSHINSWLSSASAETSNAFISFNSLSATSAEEELASMAKPKDSELYEFIEEHGCSLSLHLGRGTEKLVLSSLEKVLGDNGPNKDAPLEIITLKRSNHRESFSLRENHRRRRRENTRRRRERVKMISQELREALMEDSESVPSPEVEESGDKSSLSEETEKKEKSEETSSEDV